MRSRNNEEAARDVHKLPTIKEEKKEDYNQSNSEFKESKFVRNSPELRPAGMDSNPKASETIHSAAGKFFPEKYKIVEVLGKGEGSMCYLLEDSKEGTRACLRMVKKSTYGDEDKEDISEKITNKFFLKDLKHPNLVKFKEWWMDSTNFYFIQEYIEGKELFNYIQDTEMSE